MPSDISRTWVHRDEPTKRQREVWDTVKRGQEIVLETAKIGAPSATSTSPCAIITRATAGPRTTACPGLSHRAGHGIGMDGHEPPNLDARRPHAARRPDMCFSDEPGIYIPGEFGVRMEDSGT